MLTSVFMTFFYLCFPMHGLTVSHTWARMHLRAERFGAWSKQVDASEIITNNESQNGLSWHMVASAHSRAIRALVAQLNALKGVGAMPQPGCQFTQVLMGDLAVIIEYEVEAGEPQTCYDPGCPASVSILQVFLNGAWVDPADFVSDEVLARWEQEIVDHLADHEDAASDCNARAAA